MPWRGSPLRKDDEKALFRAYNFAKFRLDSLRKGLNPKRYVPAGQLEAAEALKRTARQIRGCLLKAFGPLAESVAKTHVREGLRLDDLVREAAGFLEELVDSYDFRSAGRFADYASLELLKRFARTVPGDA